jgi:hypothetical protein
MSAAGTTPEDPQPGPAWRDAATLATAAEAYARARAEGRNTSDAASVATDTVRALHPAWPATMVSEVVSAAVVGVDQAQAAIQQDAADPGDAGGPLRPARAEDVTAVLAYALRFGLDGKPRRTATDFLAPLAAAQIYQHLQRAGLVILQKPATQPHPGMG